MGLKHLMTLNGRMYGKMEARELMKSILNSNKMGSYLRDADFQAVKDIIDYHPESTEKIGSGISEIQIVREPMYGGRRFEIIRTDGSRQDFSYIKCASKPSSEHREDVLKAFRYAIWYQIQSFKSKIYGDKKRVRCAITGLNIQKKDCEIDHAPPMSFSTLVFNFLKKEGLTLSDIKVKNTEFIACLDLVDTRIKSKWQTYHKTHAILRATLDHANRGQKRVKVDWTTL